MNVAYVYPILHHAELLKAFEQIHSEFSYFAHTLRHTCVVVSTPHFKEEPSPVKGRSLYILKLAKLNLHLLEHSLAWRLGPALKMSNRKRSRTVSLYSDPDVPEPAGCSGRDIHQVTDISVRGSSHKV